MKLTLMILTLALWDHAYSLSIGETLHLPDESIRVSSGKHITIEQSIWVVGEERSYEAWYDLKDKEVVERSVYAEIQELFELKKFDVVSRKLTSALITAFTVDEEPGYSCLFMASNDWEPICLEHK